MIRLLLLSSALTLAPLSAMSQTTQTVPIETAPAPAETAPATGTAATAAPTETPTETPAETPTAAAQPAQARQGGVPASQVGPNPDLPAPRRGLLPDMTVPRPALWGDDLPTVPAGFTIAAIATDLKIPRQTLVLPNGDILVAEGTGGGAPALRPKDLIANFIKGLGKSSVEGGNRLTLLQ